MPSLTTASNPTGGSRESPGSLTNNTCFSNVAPWTGILALSLNSYGILSQFLSPLELFVFLSKKWATICEVHGNTAGTQDELKSNSGIPHLTTVSGTPLSRLKGKHCRWLSPSLIVCHPRLLTTGLLSILPSAFNLFTVLPVFPNVSFEKPFPSTQSLLPLCPNSNPQPYTQTAHFDCVLVPPDFLTELFCNCYVCISSSLLHCKLLIGITSFILQISHWTVDNDLNSAEMC